MRRALDNTALSDPDDFTMMKCTGRFALFFVSVQVAALIAGEYTNRTLDVKGPLLVSYCIYAAALICFAVAGPGTGKPSVFYIVLAGLGFGPQLIVSLLLLRLHVTCRT